ncbi:SDR family NAD(P)-dependent oxidoreductase [Microbacterium sp. NPDC055683]
MAPEHRDVIVIGARSNIATRIAETFAAHGDHVHLLGRTVQHQHTLPPPSECVAFHRVDVVDPDEARTAIETIATAYGSIDVLVINTGVFSELADADVGTYPLWDRIVAVNVVEPASQAMVRQRSGRIIVVYSTGIARSEMDECLIHAAEAGLQGLIRRLAVRLGGQGITANSVAVATNIVASRALEVADSAGLQRFDGDVPPPVDGWAGGAASRSAKLRRRGDRAFPRQLSRLPYQRCDHLRRRSWVERQLTRSSRLREARLPSGRRPDDAAEGRVSVEPRRRDRRRRNVDWLNHRRLHSEIEYIPRASA